MANDPEKFDRAFAFADRMPESIAHSVRNQVLSICDLKQNGEAPAARAGAKSVVIASDLFMFGGVDEASIQQSTYKLEIGQMKWSKINSVGDAPSGRIGHSFHAIGPDEIVLFGGFEQDLKGTKVVVPFGPWSYSGTLSNDVFVLNSRTLEWRRQDCSGSLPPPTAFHASCFDIVNERIVIHGGYLDESFRDPSSEMYILDLKSWTWSNPSITQTEITPRACHGIACNPTVGPATYFVFGDDQKLDNQLYEIDSKIFTCKIVPVVGTCPLARRFLSLELVGNRLYCFGGETFLHGLTDVYVYVLGSNRWSKPLYEGSLSIRAHAGCVLHDKLMVFGGVREKAGLTGGSEYSIAKKLFFLNVLEIKDTGSQDETGSSSTFKFKIVTVGDSGVGKSCLLTRFVTDSYSDLHISTIGVDYKTVVTMVKGKLVKLLLWDTAGQERFSVVTGNYYRNADGFVIVYDATNRASFDHVDHWMDQIKQHHECGPNTVKILCANKHDLVNEIVVSETEGKAKAEALGAIFVATSARTSSNVDFAFLTGAQSLVEIRRNQQAQQASSNAGMSVPGVSLGGRSSSRVTQQKCCT